MAETEEITTEDETEDSIENATRPTNPPNKHLKPDAEDDQLKEEATLLGEDDWIEKCFDPDFEQTQLDRPLRRFIEKGYAKLGRKLGRDLVGIGLSMSAETTSGLSHAYVKLDLPGKAIIEISLLRNFAHLRYVNLGGNHVDDIKPLNHLQFLLTLDLSDNYLTSLADLTVHADLRVLNVSRNFLRDLRGIVEHPRLQRLYLSYNKLTEFALLSSQHLRKLEVLELRKNRLQSFGGNDLKLPALRVLFLAQNAVDKLGNFLFIKKVEFLDLRRNKLTSLVGCKLPSVRYLNLSWNFITELVEIDYLARSAPEVRTLIIKNNAVNADEKTRTRAIVKFAKLTRLNALVVGETLRKAALLEYNEDTEAEQKEIVDNEKIQ